MSKHINGSRGARERTAMLFMRKVKLTHSSIQNYLGPNCKYSLKQKAESVSLFQHNINMKSESKDFGSGNFSIRLKNLQIVRTICLVPLESNCKFFYLVSFCFEASILFLFGLGLKDKISFSSDGGFGRVPNNPGIQSKSRLILFHSAETRGPKGAQPADWFQISAVPLEILIWGFLNSFHSSVCSELLAIM